MKQIITFIILILAFTTNSYAVTSTINTNGNDAITITKKSKNSIFTKIKTFVNKTIVKIAKQSEDEETLILILGIVLPPLGLYLYEGKEWTNRVTLNLIFWILFFPAAIVHALIIITGKK